jgi:hypothetical protein
MSDSLKLLNENRRRIIKKQSISNPYSPESADSRPAEEFAVKSSVESWHTAQEIQQTPAYPQIRVLSANATDTTPSDHQNTPAFRSPLDQPVKP